jgi:Protein of unknown function (DUF1553)/Protein of unknown function (DUF1549)/Planctomycete cytochrome C
MIFFAHSPHFSLSMKLSPLFFFLPIICQAEEKVTFNRDIRPILSDKCIGCHGPDAKHREAGLRLDIAEAAYAPLTESQGFAIVPGKPEESLILKRIDSKDRSEVMPPPKSHKTVNQAERHLFERWIREGAVYQPHWAYTPLLRPDVPAVKNPIQNPLDAFILAALEAKNIAPSADASPNDLLRRLSLDLTGLPPSPQEVAEFSSDPSTYDQKVEAFLASPRYGERMAVPWLDAVRYADTVGFHGDQNLRIFAYRDYVIDSFNSNKRFDVFTREQIAGDLLPNPSDEQRIASAFNRLNLMTREGGAQPKEYLAKYSADRVRAIGIAFLGQTTGCAECHDHKYDPISAKDFYSMAAFFADVQQWGVYANYNYTPESELKGLNNEWPFPPEFVSQSPALFERMKRIEADIFSLLSQVPAEQKSFDSWRETMKSYATEHPDGWQIHPVKTTTSNKKTPVNLQSDGSAIASGESSKGDEILYDLGANTTASIGSLRIEAMPDPSLQGFVGRSPQGHFSITPSVEIIDATGKVTPVKIAYSQADLSRPESYSSGYEKSITFGATWMSAPALLEQPADLTKRTQTSVLCFHTPITIPSGGKLAVRVKSSDVGRLRFSTSPLLNPVPGQPAFTQPFLKDLSSSTTPYHLCNTAVPKLPEKYQTLLTEMRLCRGGWNRTVTTVSVPDEKKLTTRILPRGNWQDESGAIVKPAVLSFLPHDSTPKDRELNRLDLANWITAKENPLTARNYVNRMWKQFFGKGLSNVLDDLGGQGEAPSHPELLDWLACEFRDSGWDTKHIVRLIVTSKTYRQSAATRKEMADIDPANRMLAQQSSRRLDAEFIRDNALTIAGLLDVSYAGGPPSKPYQPPGYYTAIQFPNRDWKTDTGHSRMRRGLYTHWQRTFMHPMLANFDAPSREECSADRMQANTPQQALTLLNDPVFVEAANALAERIKNAGSLQASLTQAFSLALSRSPRDEEIKGLIEFHNKQLALFTSGENKATNVSNEQAALAQTCRVVLNLHECITRY